MPSIREKRSGGRTAGALLAIGAVLWVIAPLAIAAAVTLQSRAIELTPDRPVWAPVEANAGQVAEPVDVVLEWQPVSPVVAPAWSGVVQSVGITPGSALSSGQPVAVIDGITRLAHHSDRPFFRTLARDDSGPDAAALNSLLTQAGYDSGGGDRVTRGTLAGVRTLAAALGVPHAAEVEAFDPAWLVFLPAAVVDVGTVDLVVGAPAPAAGTVIAELVDQLASAYLAEPAGDDETDRRPLVADEEQRLTVAGVELELAEDRGRIADPAALRALVAEESTSVTGRLSRAAGEREWVVPAAAVFAGSGGATCVVTGSQQHPRSIEVSVLGGQLGRAIVTGDLRAGERVSVGPAAELRRCG